MTQTTEHRYEDRFGAVIDRAGADLLEIRWYDATAEMSRDAFNQWLTTFAEQVEQMRRPYVLVDATRFRMDMAQMDGAYRDAQIIPRYNAAGVQRFAFLMPEGMPLIGAEPAPEGPAEFPTAYFGHREDALRWLLGE